jgi:transposase
MFLKRQTRRKNGKAHTYWELVESVRTPRGSRHKRVAYLGELSQAERSGWARLGMLLDGRAAQSARQLSLFENVPDEGEPVPDEVAVDLRKLKVENARSFGDVYLAMLLWKTLELDSLLGDRLPEGREEIRWGLMACMISVSRFVEPASEVHISDRWYGRTALPEVLGVPTDKAEEHRLYRTLDRILPLKRDIETHLKERIGELFKPELDLVLYDVTSTYFEGEAANNDQAKLGYSRDHRSDCKQVCIALVVTKDGFPLGYEVFDGNRTDVTTVEDIVEEMEGRYGTASRVWVMDRGMVSQENIEFFKEGKRRYIVGTPRAMLKAFQQQLLEEDWTSIRDGLEVKLCRTPDSDDEVFILCRSADRRKKEKAMHERFEKRIDDGLTKMANGCQRCRQDPGVVERRVGKLLGTNTRAAGMFEVSVTGTRETGARVTWTKKPEWREWASLSEGCYLLRTNVTDWKPDDLWRAYIQLAEAEDAFRIHKTELCVRPIWHHLKERVQAHILFSFLAYAMWKTLQTWMVRAGLGRGARTVIDELAQIRAVDVVLQTTRGRRVRIACVTRPSPAQQALLDRLGIELPERLGRPRWIPAPADPDTECSLDFETKTPQIDERRGSGC